MNSLAAILTAAIAATWMSAIAILSIQNITAVSLKFLAFSSIQMPLGVLLAFSAAAGWLVGAILPLFSTAKPARRRTYPDPSSDDFEDFDIT